MAPRKVEMINQQIAAAQQIFQEENQRPMTAEELAEETRLVYAKQKAGRKEGGKLISLLHDYCFIVTGRNLSVKKASSGVTMSVTTPAGEEFRAEGATKIEAAEDMLRWMRSCLRFCC